MISLKMLLSLVSLLVLIVMPTPVLAQPVADLPTNLLVDWQGNGAATIKTPIPLLSWDNPSGEGEIDTVVVRVGKNPEMGFCPADLVIDHWFTTTDSPPPCQISSSTKSPFTKDTPPTSYIVSPTNPLQDGQTYYWAVNIHKNNTWYSSAGYIEGIGGSTLSGNSFTINVVPVDHNIYGVGVEAHSQIKYRKLENNPQGISELINSHMGWAQKAVGSKGTVKFWFHDIDANSQNAPSLWKQTLQAAYDRDLIPVIRLQGVWTKAPVTPWEGFVIAPTPDADGSYESVAQGYKRVLADLRRTTGNSRPLILELGNEMNYDNENWGYLERTDPNNPEAYRKDPANAAREYAKFYVDVYQAIKELNDPDIKIMVGGIGRCGDIGFIRELLKSEELRRYVVADGLWATHVYPLIQSENHDEFQVNLGSQCNLSPLGYKYQLDELARAGIDVSNVKVIVTEGGYSRTVLGSEDKKAGKTIRLMEIFKLDSGRIDRVTLFLLDHFLDTDVLDFTKPQFDPKGDEADTNFDVYTWTHLDSGTDSEGWPTKYTATYAAITKVATGQTSPAPLLSTIFGGTIPKVAVKYRVSETSQGLDDPTALTGVVRPQVPISYSFSDPAPGIKPLHVRFYYLNGETTDNQTLVTIRQTPSPTPIPTPITATPVPAATLPTDGARASCSGNQLTITWNQVLGSQNYTVRVNNDPQTEWSPEYTGLDCSSPTPQGRTGDRSCESGPNLQATINLGNYSGNFGGTVTAQNRTTQSFSPVSCGR